MTVIFDAQPSFVGFNDSNFDSRYKYLRQRSGSSPMSLTRGATWDLGATGPEPRYQARGRAGPSASGPANSSVDIDVGVNAGSVGASLDLSPLGIVIKDAATGLLLHDTSVPMMHVLAEFSGSIAIPSANASGSGTSYTLDRTIGTVPAQATDVIGVVRTVYDVGQPTATTTGTEWWAINGSFVSFCDIGTVGTGAAAGQVTAATGNSLCSWSQMTFLISGTSMIMREVTYCRALFAGGQFNPEGGGSVASYIRQPYTLFYKLKAVAFS